MAIGISTPEHDQNSLLQLMREGWLDSVQVIYNIFEQEPAAEFLPAAKENNVGAIVRVVFDEGSLTGKFTKDTKFAKNDFRRRYFKGDRLADTVERVERIRQTIADYSDEAERGLFSTAVRFALKHDAVSTVIPGIRTVKQAEVNCGTAQEPPLSDELYEKLKEHYWLRAFWYAD